MSADRLREAARVLREVVSASSDGRWVVSKGSPSDYEASIALPDQPDDVFGDVADVWMAEDATYIATMSPPVALAVADWLDAEVIECEALVRHRITDGSGIPHRDAEREVFRNHPALTVADAILGAS
ncbi:hypothetical protein [Aeromicrobium piscarium]|uniref:Uncharacterized protein n=1 Tax=Aeromicrobium piscarium TaxID=2590901 RepID=A0A554SP57_9ACTN|nr:hypothetical protein [Aeromicrobium piscarium]TSD68098.1 hypothetical protein FNM00_00440 [Aeromicrobium piscarium]